VSRGAADKAPPICWCGKEKHQETTTLEVPHLGKQVAVHWVCVDHAWPAYPMDLISSKPA